MSLIRTTAIALVAAAGLTGQAQAQDAEIKIGSDRFDGVRAKLGEAGIEAVLAPGWGEWSADGGFTQMEDMLARETDIATVFCEDDSMCLGAQRAINDASMGHDIFITAVDGEKGTLKEILREGTNYGATGLNSSVAIGTAGFNRLMAILAGAKPEQRTVLPSPIITGENAGMYYDENSVF